MRTISYSAFEGCGQLESINLGKGLQTIEWHSFDYCTQLRAIELPATLSELSKMFFWSVKILVLLQ